MALPKLSTIPLSLDWLKINWWLTLRMSMKPKNRSRFRPKSHSCHSTAAGLLLYGVTWPALHTPILLGILGWQCEFGPRREKRIPYNFKASSNSSPGTQSTAPCLPSSSSLSSSGPTGDYTCVGVSYVRRWMSCLVRLDNHGLVVSKIFFHG